MPMISVIVPVYNTEKYLDRCIQSILAQTYSNFELLLVDDGSTDSSGAICDRYAEQDSRVRVFHKVNGGASTARNMGLDNAKGEYLIFLDADDYWFEDAALEQLHNIAIKNNLDIIRGEYKAVNERGEDLFIRPITQAKKNIENKVIDNVLFLNNAIGGEYFFVLCLVKRASLGFLRYNNKRCFLEDMELVSQLMLTPMRCMYTSIYFYAYRKLSSSASNSIKDKNVEDSFAMCDMFNILSKQTQDLRLKNIFVYNSIMMYYWTLDTLSLDPYYQKHNELINKFNLVLLQNKVCQWAKNSNRKYPYLIRVAPVIGVKMLRFKHFCGKLLRKLKFYA